MTVYIEYVIIDNLVITALIITLSGYTAGLRVRRIRVLAASVFGTVVALLLPFVGNAVVLLVIRASLAVMLVCICTVPNRIRRIVRFGIIFLGMTFVFGGTLFAIGFVLTGDVYTALTVPLVDIPLGVILGAGLVVFAVTKRLVLRLKRSGDKRGFLADVEMELLGKTLRVEGLIDSGNGLYDAKSGLPIVVLSLKSVLQSLSGDLLVKFLSGRGESITRGARYIDVETITGKDKLLILPCGKFLLYPKARVHRMYNKSYDVMVGLRATKMGTDIVLHPCMLA